MSGTAEAGRVTVVVTSYNSGPALSRTIESVLDQGYGDWRGVIVDAASQETAPHETAKSFAARDGRLVAFRLARNVGVAAARNAAIEASGGGELVALLDHDDRWRDDYLERSVAAYDEALARGRRVGIV